MVSIVIPTYNRADMLFECLNSILYQSYNNFEILVVDDGSNDHTELIVSKLKDDRILYFKLDKLGNISYLRNYGLEHSSGEIIAFCDDDDVWLPDKLEVQLPYLKQFDFICSNAELVGAENQKLGRKYFSDSFGSFILTTKHLLTKNYVIASSVVLNKGIIPKMPFDISRYKSTAEDYDLWIKLSLKYQLFFLNEPLIKYRVHANLTFDRINLPKIYMNSIDIIKKYMGMVPKDERKYASYGICKNRIEYIKLVLHLNRFWEAIKEIFKLLWESRKPDYMYLLVKKWFNSQKTFF